jgi:hypothetical protein
VETLQDHKIHQMDILPEVVVEPMLQDHLIQVLLKVAQEELENQTQLLVQQLLTQVVEVVEQDLILILKELVVLEVLEVVELVEMVEQPL